MSLIKIRNVGSHSVAAVLLAAATFWSVTLSAQVPGPDPQVTEALCTACHRDKFEALPSNPHREIESPVCQNCHGDVGAHISAGGGLGNVFAFREETSVAQNGVCLDCHTASHPEFDSSAHALAGLSCTDCHRQHAPPPAPRALLHEGQSSLIGLFDQLGRSSQLCVDCHDDVLTAFDFNERHRLREGVLECTSCHDPHARVSRSLLGGFKQQECLECHSDKGGPFVFEHPASRVEGCTSCHSPHGSPNRHMLSHQRVGELCVTCHAAVPQFHVGFSPVGPPRFGLDTQCTNCHSTIHGSNFDPNYLK